MAERMFEVVATVRVTYQISAESADAAKADIHRYLDNPEQALDLIDIEAVNCYDEESSDA